MTYAANGSVLAAGGETASKRPGAGGNIGGRLRADLVAQYFDLYGRRCACCGSGDAAVAEHTARSCSAETRGMHRRLRDSGFPEGTGERWTPAHIDGKRRCCACNEIKLPEKEFG